MRRLGELRGNLLPVPYDSNFVAIQLSGTDEFPWHLRIPVGTSEQYEMSGQLTLREYIAFEEARQVVLPDKSFTLVGSHAATPGELLGRWRLSTSMTLEEAEALPDTMNWRIRADIQKGSRGPTYEDIELFTPDTRILHGKLSPFRPN